MVTGMEGVRTVASQEDRLDRLLISFKDAKVCVVINRVVSCILVDKFCREDCSFGVGRLGIRPCNRVHSHL